MSTQKTNIKKPYLSIITPSRNDDYGKDMLKRLQFSFDVTFELLNKYEVDSEIIFVDWNPPRDRKKLSEALTVPKHSGFVTVRFIQVAPHHHEKYHYAAHNPLHRSAAMNSGIRRARGEFVVVRMSDVIWSEKLVSQIATKELDTSTKYRCTRKDVDPEVLKFTGSTLEEKLSACDKFVTATMEKIKYYVKDLPNLKLNSDGDFQLLPAGVFRMLRGYQENEIVNSPDVDGLLEYCALAAGVKDELLQETFIFKLEHDQAYKNRALSTFFPNFPIIAKLIPPNLVSSKIIASCRLTGLTRLFYDNRPRRFKGIPQPTRNDFFNQCKKIVSGEIPYVLNNESWGLGGEDLSEEIVTRASWDT
jgi:hypothetical protein